MADGTQLIVRHHTMLPQSLQDAGHIAEYIAQSGLFGCKTKAQAFALMLLADAEGLHPAAAARDYHIIEGKPSLRADAMLARYMAAGGKIKWLKREPEAVSAEFTHPSSGTVAITWDKKRAELAGFWGKNNWRKHPVQMLSARVISEGVRASFPGVVSGLYAPEEVEDFGGPRETIRVEQPAPAEDAITEDGEVVEAEVVEPDPEPQPGTKADSRDLYATLQKGLRSCKSSHELRQWGTAFADDIKKLPKDWATGLREDYRAEMNAFLDHEEKEQLKDAYDAV